MDKLKKDGLYLVELNDGYKGYYNYVMDVVDEDDGYKIRAFFRENLPSTDSDHVFVELEKIKSLKEIFATDDFGELENDYMKFQKEYNKVHWHELLIKDPKREDEQAWNDWVTRNNITIVNELESWVDGLFYSDGEIDMPTVAIGVFWRYGYKACLNDLAKKVNNK